jgi:hypothetical protein
MGSFVKYFSLTFEQNWKISYQIFGAFLENMNFIDARLETPNLNQLYQTGVFFSV